ncbi:hypothetical protein PAXRUDRAFT_834347, partial [Paxillus rubicundulus Ve08.2h10]
MEALRYAPFPGQFRPNDSDCSQDRTPRKRSRGEHQHTGNRTSALGYRSPCALPGRCRSLVVAGVLA